MGTNGSVIISSEIGSFKNSLLVNTNDSILFLDDHLNNEIPSYGIRLPSVSESYLDSDALNYIYFSFGNNICASILFLMAVMFSL